jgi:hypothetical protein
MTIPLLDSERIFLDYLDEDYTDFGYKLVDNAPDEAVKALASYLKRVNNIESGIR